MRAALSSAVLVALGAFAAPASAADVTIRNFSFTPTPITIDLGDTVTWHYAGPDTNHSVTSDPGQADSFDSDPGGPPSSADHPAGSSFDHTFNTAGTFTYFCKVHAGMRGRVIVRAPGGGDGPGPDTTAPAISSLTAKGGRTCSRRARRNGCRGKPTRLSFDLSEDARVEVSVPGRAKAATAKAGHAGSNRVRISTRKLPPGRYQVKLTATDAAGNDSATETARVRVKRKRR